MTDDEIRQAIMTKLTVPIWPTAGRALGFGRNGAYEAAKKGVIPTIDCGRKKPVPTAALRRLLGLDEKAAA
jgi:hypothetical protein